MEYIIETWKLKELIDKIDTKEINLNPPYQRNPIWTKKTQWHLIKSIYDGKPIPNIFLNKLEKGYEMVDGQQRTRAILLYCKGEEINLGVPDENEFKSERILNYLISVITITKVEEEKGEYIDEYYYMVNSSGIKLNRPETLKAQFFHTNFLSLVEELCINQDFVSLNIVPTSSKKRMMDRDLIEEICALFLYGITDKKIQVDKIYTSDITKDELENCRVQFNESIKKLLLLNEHKKISETRYRQRNDFYTLISFLKNNDNLSTNSLIHIYKLLILIEDGIRPSKDACIPLAEYALNCVSQSNSAKARFARLDIITKLFLNSTDSPNETQLHVKNYYPSELDYFSKFQDYLSFNIQTLDVAILAIESN
jgi:Protein of unknown function DUF262